MASQKREKKPRAPRETKDLKGLTGADREAAQQHNFRTIARKRVPRAIRAVKQIASLGNTGSYRYSPEQVLKILTALTEAVAHVKASFEKPASGTPATFDI